MAWDPVRAVAVPCEQDSRKVLLEELGLLELTDPASTEETQATGLVAE